MGTRGSAETRFWRRVVKANGEGCWEWIGGRSGRYGRFRLDNDTMVWAHRFAYELQHGPLPPGLCACHACDNPLCMRGDHLFAGTRSENIADRDAKGRQSKGPTHSEAIRRSWLSRRAAATTVLADSQP